MRGILSTLVAVVVLSAVGQTAYAQYAGQDASGGYYGNEIMLTGGQQPMAAPAPGAYAPNAYAPPPGAYGPCDDNCYKWQFFSDYLYLRPRGGEVDYGIPVNTIDVDGSPIPQGVIGSANPEFDSGYRFGFNRVLTEDSMFGLTYTGFEGNVRNEMAVAAGRIQPMVSHPNTLATAAVWTSASARQDIDFKLVDLDYRHVFLAGDTYEVNYLIGARYANLEQSFDVGFFGANPALDETVFSRVNFDGAGIRLGLEGERRSANTGLLVYGKGIFNVVGGDFRASYLQVDGVNPTAVASWKTGRVMTITELEAGLGWMNSTGRLRVTGGYMLSSWAGVIRTADWIRGVRQGDFRGLDNASDNVLNFDGLVLRTELRF